MEEIIRWKHVITRKPHKCFGCGLEYPAGSDMVSAAYVEDKAAYGCYWCSTCEEYMRQHFEHGDGTGYGEIYENDQEEWERIKKDIADD